MVKDKSLCIVTLIQPLQCWDSFYLFEYLFYRAWSLWLFNFASGGIDLTWDSTLKSSMANGLFIFTCEVTPCCTKCVRTSLSWCASTFSTKPSMLIGGLGKYSNQCWHQFTAWTKNKLPDSTKKNIKSISKSWTSTKYSFLCLFIVRPTSFFTSDMVIIQTMSSAF